MTIERLDNAPLADRARSAILEAIIERRFEQRLPSEEVLAEMLNVSRTTIRSALQSLEQEGIITRKRAVGTTINAHVGPSTLALQRLVGFDGLLREKGYDVRVESTWRRGNPDADVVEIFSIEAADDYLLTEKSYFAGEALAIFIRDAVPSTSLRVEEFDDPLPASLFEFSSRYCHQRVDHAVVEIVACVKRDGNTTCLPLEVGEPFTRLHERHYSSTGEPAAFSVIDVDNQYVTFEVFRKG